MKSVILNCNHDLNKLLFTTTTGQISH